jgi:hypothetical protein
MKKEHGDIKRGSTEHTNFAEHTMNIKQTAYIAQQENKFGV